MAQRPNLILTFAVGYGADAIEMFVRSFRRNVHAASMHVFTKDIRPDAVELFRSHGIGTTDCSAYLEVAEHHGYNIYAARHFLLQSFLSRRGGFDKVLLTDIRDVIFQADPFLLPFPGDVLFAAEDKLIEQCPTNSSWIRQAYGPDVLAIIKRHPVSCAGTVLGTRDGIIRYLETMCAEIRKHPGQDSDQGIHNFVASGLRPLGMAVDPHDTIISTLDQTPAERVVFHDGAVLVDGRATAIIHQWDRQVHLREPVVAAWRNAARD